MRGRDSHWRGGWNLWDNGLQSHCGGLGIRGDLVRSGCKERSKVIEGSRRAECTETVIHSSKDVVGMLIFSHLGIRGEEGVHD